MAKKLNKSVKKVFVVGYSKNYANFIDNFKLVDNIEEADIVIFTGGEDVCPSLYNEEALKTTYYNIDRDMAEKAVFEKCTDKQLVIGICRGSQFLCVMNGGKLIQDVSGHAIGHTHEIKSFYTDAVYSITSTHHQMQYPYNLNPNDYDLLYTSDILSSYYFGGGIDEREVCFHGEPEIVLYHKSSLPKCLAIQGHPEYMRKDAPVIAMLNELIDNLLSEIKNN